MASVISTTATTESRSYSATMKCLQLEEELEKCKAVYRIEKDGLQKMLKATQEELETQCNELQSAKENTQKYLAMVDAQHREIKTLQQNNIQLANQLELANGNIERELCGCKTELQALSNDFQKLRASKKTNEIEIEECWARIENLQSANNGLIFKKKAQDTTVVGLQLPLNGATNYEETPKTTPKLDPLPNPAKFIVADSDDGFNSDDSLETEISNLLPGYGRGKCLETELNISKDSSSPECWDINPIPNTTLPPALDGRANIGKDSWARQKINELFDAMEIEYDERLKACHVTSASKSRLSDATIQAGTTALVPLQPKVAEVKSISASWSISNSAFRSALQNPFKEHELLDRFEVIREVSVSGVPRDATPEDILKQVTCGAIDKVIINTKVNEAYIVFIEPIAARAQYIKYHNKGFWIPRRSDENSKGSFSPIGRYFRAKLNPFTFTERCMPMSPQLQEAINTRGVTRVLQAKRIPESWTLETIHKCITALDLGDQVIETILLDLNLVIIRFTSVLYCVKTLKFLKNAPAWRNVHFCYSADPCDQEHLTGMNRGETKVNEPVPLQIEPPEVRNPVSIEQALAIKDYSHRFKNNVITTEMSDDKPEKLSFLAERGLFSKTSVRTKPGLDESVHRWDDWSKEHAESKTALTEMMENVTSSEEAERVEIKKAIKPKQSASDWTINESHAVNAYRAKMVEKKSVGMTAVVYPPERYMNRLVYVVGLPVGTTYSKFCPYVKGGPVDTIRIDTTDWSAYIVFMLTKDAERYKKFISSASVYIDSSRLIVKSPPKKLSNMRLWEVEKVTNNGLTRCLFIEGLPPASTVSSIKADLAGIEPKSELFYEKFIVNSVIARVFLPSISMANFIERNLFTHPKYTGIRVRYEADPCAGELSSIPVR